MRLFRTSVKREYRARMLSFAFIYRIFSIFLLFFLPLLFSLQTNEFFNNTTTRFITPDYEFASKYFFSFSGASTSFIYTNIPDVEAHFSDNQLRTGSFQIVPDGNCTNLAVNVPLKTGESVDSMTGLLFFTTKISDSARIETENVVLIQTDGNPSFSTGYTHLDTIGRVSIHQRVVLPVRKLLEEKESLLTTTILDDHGANFVKEVVFQYMSKRSVNIKYTPVLDEWSMGSSDSMDLNARLFHDGETLYVERSLFETLTFSFIIYLAYFLVVYWFERKISTFVFSSELVYAVSDLTDCKLTKPKMN
ncbi:hypothetical protein PCE1_003528 [Barthelona sp. PCE]